jgi:hypothetical protein
MTSTTKASRQSFRLKPMNCPSHMTLYKEMGRHSYREFPMRFAEFATLYRYEKTGELTGLIAGASPDPGRLPYLLYRGPDREQSFRWLCS